LWLDDIPLRAKSWSFSLNGTVTRLSDSSIERSNESVTRRNGSLRRKERSLPLTDTSVSLRTTPFQLRDEALRLPDRALDAMRGSMARRDAAIALVSSGFARNGTGFRWMTARVWATGVPTKATMAFLCVVVCR
jgi:hypothetical protein